MTTPTDLTTRILVELGRAPLDHYQLAAGIGEPPFRVRDRLKRLKRERLVKDVIDRGRIMWGLTGRGQAAVAEARQLRMGLTS